VIATVRGQPSANATIRSPRQIARVSAGVSPGCASMLAISSREYRSGAVGPRGAHHLGELLDVTPKGLHEPPGEL
jgi:hypothetical protein